MTPFLPSETFRTNLKALAHERGARLSAAKRGAVLPALGERDETAEICGDKDGNSELDTELRDIENVPPKELKA
ncbi:MAG: hypothetical protein O3C40_07030 [Planctomycetota bacterium]|nr:hypothetical protein [Planctomycetota bacterium]